MSQSRIEKEEISSQLSSGPFIHIDLQKLLNDTKKSVDQAFPNNAENRSFQLTADQLKSLQTYQTKDKLINALMDFIEGILITPDKMEFERLSIDMMIMIPNIANLMNSDEGKALRDYQQRLNDAQPWIKYQISNRIEEGGNEAIPFNMTEIPERPKRIDFPDLSKNAIDLLYRLIFLHEQRVMNELKCLYLKELLLRELELDLFISELNRRASTKENKEKRTFIQSSTPRLDVNRALSGNPRCFIRTSDTAQKKETTKIIVNVPQLQFVDGFNQLFKLLKQCKDTTEHNFYAFHNGKLVPFIDKMKIDMLSSAEIRKTLSEQHKNIQNYYILDYKEWNNIVTAQPGIANSKFRDFFSKIHYKNAWDQKDINKPEIDYFLNNTGFDEIILSMYERPGAENFLTELMSRLTDHEQLTIATNGGSIESYTLDFPKEVRNIKKLTLSLWHCKKLENMHHFSSLEALDVDCSQLTELDLSSLNHLNTVIVRRLALNKIKLNPSQKINFFIDEVCFSPETINTLGLDGISIEWTKKPESVASSESIPSYNEIPSIVEKKTAHHHTELTQSINLINHAGPIIPRDYRKKILTTMQMTQNGDLLFKPFAFNDSNAELVNLQAIQTQPRNQFNKQMAQALNEEAPGSYLGVIALSTKDAQWVPLTSLSAQDKLVLLDKNRLQMLEDNQLKLDIRFAKETQQYFVRIAKTGEISSPVPTTVNLLYGMSPYQGVSDYKAEPSIPADIKAGITVFLERAQEIEDLDPSIEEAKKSLKTLGIYIKQGKIIEGLKNFCSSFSEKEISNEIKDYVQTLLADRGIENVNIHHFMSVLFAQAGACDHRSKVFMAMAHYLGIPARIIHNDVHACVEYFENNQWKKMDLGGGAVDKMNTMNAWPEIEQDIPANKQIENEFENSFRTDEQELNEEKGFPDWYQALIEIPGHPLLKFKHPQEAFELHSHLMALENKEVGNNYFYIHHPSDFDKLLTQLEVKSNGQCHEIKGPLLKMIERGHGTLLINWSHFSEKQIANYKSVLDSTPTLQGYRLSPTTCIINISQVESQACSAFYSRTRKVAWPKNLAPQDIQRPLEFKSIDSQAIDLYESREWESILIGKLRIKGDSYSYSEGALLSALRQNKSSICLTGLPKAPSFQVFMERLMRERGFYANGAYYSLPKDFTVYFSPTPESQAVSSPYDLNSADEKETLYVNKQNFYQLFEKYTIDAQGKAHINQGLLFDIPSDSTLIITDHLSSGEMRRLQTELRKNFPHIKLMALSHLISKSESPEIKSPRASTNLLSASVVISNDVDSAARAIKSEQDKVVDISKITEFSDLFESTTFKNDDKNKTFLGQKTLSFNHETFELLEHLQKGNQVILKGDISSELYHQLESLFSKPPFLLINGEHKEIKGRLILITPENKEAPHLFDSAVQYRHNFSWDNVPHYLMSKMGIHMDEAQTTTARIKDFYNEMAKIKHTGDTTPPQLLLTEDRILEFAQAMKADHRSPKSNPIKQIFQQNYTEDKENFAKISVKAKMFLSDENEAYDVDQIKLLHLLQKNTDPIDHIKWQILNCFSSSYLRNNSLLISRFQASTPGIEDLKNLAITLRSKIKSPLPREQKQSQLVHELLESHPYIELRGTPGTGKTHFIEHELNHHSNADTFWGEEKILEWLNTSPTSAAKKQYLLLDEANMKEPGYWDFLKGITNGEIYYKGKSYPVSSETHKIIFTGNPENYPGRHYHDFLQKVPKVYFKSHTDAYLSETIIGPFVAEQFGHLPAESRKEIVRGFIASYHLVIKELPFEPIGIRDFKSIFGRLMNVDSTIEDIDAYSKACLACIEVFAPLFKNQSSRNAYMDAVKLQFNIQNVTLEKLPTHDPDYILPSTKQLLWNNICHCVTRRQDALEKDLPMNRAGILVEGPSGIGKSEMMLQALKIQGYSAYDENAHNAQFGNKVYFHITMGSENISDIILKAFHSGAVVVIDELNLLTQKDEELLTHLLEGRTPEKEKARECGFCVLASQNSQLYAGRKPLSAALLNRLDRFYEEPYTRQDLLEIAIQSGKFSNDRVEHFVDRFLTQQKKDPENINVRNFFMEIKSRVSANHSEPSNESTQQSIEQSKIYKKMVDTYKATMDESSKTPGVK